MTAPRFRNNPLKGCKTRQDCNITKDIYKNRTSEDRIRRRVSCVEYKTDIEKKENSNTNS